MLRTLVFVVIFVVAFFAAGSCGECAGFYQAFQWSTDGSYADLGTLQGGTDSWAYTNNHSGQAAGWSINSAGERRAVRWNTDGTVVDLGPGVGYGMNDSGQVAGESNGRAVFWDTNGTMHDIGPGLAQCVNNHGQVTGSITVVNSGKSEYHAFIWSPSSGLRDIGKPTDTAGAMATGININGRIAGVVYDQNDLPSAFVWSNDVHWNMIGDGSAVDINDAGQVAGNSLLGQGFLWSQDTGRVGIPLVTANGMGPTGQVVGFSYVGGNPHAVLWQSGSPVQDLGVPSNFTWSKACDINDQGQIVGAALYIPEPSTFAALILGLVGLLWRRRR